MSETHAGEQTRKDGLEDIVDDASDDSFPASDPPSFTPVSASTAEPASTAMLSGGATPHYSSFSEFYPQYLAEHQDPMIRRLHVAGTSLALLSVAAAVTTRKWRWLALAPVFGYGFAWVGHYAYERNQPGLRQPVYSLAGDLQMLRDVVTGKLPL